LAISLRLFSAANAVVVNNIADKLIICFIILSLS
jgi:hypothetical protein